MVSYMTTLDEAINLRSTCIRLRRDDKYYVPVPLTTRERSQGWE